MVVLKRVILSKRTWICFLILLAISLIAALQGATQYSQDRQLIERLDQGYPDSINLISPSHYWLGMSDGFFSSFYHFIFPLLVSIPLADLIFEEWTTGNIVYQLVRMSRRRYYLAKVSATCLCAFALCLLPMLLNMVVVNALVGQWNMSSFSASYAKLVHGTARLADSTSLSQQKELFSGLLEASPYVYAFVYYLINAAYAAAYAFFGLAVSLFIRNRYLIVMAPFILYICVWIAFSLIQLLPWDPFNFLDPRQPVTHLTYAAFVVDFLVLGLAAGVAYVTGVRRHQDVLG